MEDLYNNIHLHPMPDTHNLTDKTDKELNALLDPKHNFNILLPSVRKKWPTAPFKVPAISFCVGGPINNPKGVISCNQIMMRMMSISFPRTL